LILDSIKEWRGDLKNKLILKNKIKKILILKKRWGRSKLKRIS
jgi:hypothetical protein